MIKLAAHLEANMRNMPLADRWSIAQKAGFQACEFVWRNYNVDEVIALQAATGFEVCSLGGTTGFRPGAGRPSLLLSEEREYLLTDVAKAIAYAQKVRCPRLIMVVGDWVEGWSREQHREAAVSALKVVAPMLEEAGITVVIEPLNSLVNHKGHYLDSSAEGFAIVEAVGSPRVKVLYDVYHMQIMEGNLINTIKARHELIGYYHIAGVPGRHEPLGCEVNYPAVLDAIADTGYDSYIGLEYSPTIESEASLRQVYEALERK